jgi:hypothetical protein
MTDNSNLNASLAKVDIASIVRRVLRELETSVGPQASDNVFEFDQQVITLDDLKAIPASAKSIRVGLRAVITPSVRDELKSRGISVAKSAKATGSKPSAEVRRQLPFRRVNLQHDETVELTLFDALQKQVAARGIRLCDQAGVTAILSDRPATVVYQSIAANTSAVAINRIDDIARFNRDLRPTVLVLDVHHLPLVSLVNAVVQIARRVEKPIAGIPKITVAGGQR